ncbi:hypothetical protein [Niallia sp. 03190]|uniref:hypothetical protein n=1 Tax=Niallia sp. 03190 TaxID=3458061 RepID=UPI004044D884
MNNDLKEILRSVLKEELEPINKRLDGYEQRFDGFEQRFDGFEQRFDTLSEEIKELKDGQARLQKNIIESLGQYTEKIAEHVDNKTEALNKRVYAC